ncbi:MAG: acyltransferase [Nitrosomonadales bacterium]|nr:acyltransferase [Nitrosomonadales bacterium]
MAYHAGAPFLRGGFIGVDIFFVLSGFLITSLLVSEFDRYGSVSLRAFYMRRVLRLGPALLTLLITFCVVSFAFLGEEQANRNYIDALISLAYLTNWARAFSMHPPDVLGYTWSLSIEEQFYIVWPIALLTLLRVCKKRYQVVIFAAAIALFSWALRVYLLSNGSTPLRLYNGLDTRADALMVGCTFGVALASGLINTEGILSRLLAFMAPVSVACLSVLFVFSDLRAPWMYQFGLVAVELLTAILVIDALTNPRSFVRKFLAMRWLVWVGSISYGLYLWHYPMYRMMYAFGLHPGPVTMGLGTLATFLVAVLSYYAMEKPILKFKRNFTRTVANGSAQPAVAT